MEKDFVVGTMSTLGFITESVEQAMDSHLTYWFASRKSQGNTIKDTPSFEWVLMKAQGNQRRVEEDVKNALKIYFEELFSTVEVTTKATGIDSDRDGRFTLTIQLSVKYKNKWYDLGTSVLIAGESYKLLNRGRINARN